MNHTKPEPRLERIVVSVVMKKMMTVKQAKCGNEAVDGFSNSHFLVARLNDYEWPHWLAVFNLSF